MQQRCSPLDKKLKEIKGKDELGSIDPRELSLVPDVVIPPKFKMLKFEKYDETKCPENHLATYYHKMTRHVHNEDLLNPAGGHSKNCTVLKDKVQALIDADLTRFEELVDSHQRC